MSERTKPGLVSRLLQLVFFLACLLLSGLAALVAAANQTALDWTMLGLAVLCCMPVLVILDLACMAALAFAPLPEGEEGGAVRAHRRSVLVRVTSLLTAHLVTAILTIVTLAVPPSSLFVPGLTLASLRSYFVTLSCLSILLSLTLPGVFVNAISPILRDRKEK